MSDWLRSGIVGLFGVAYGWFSNGVGFRVWIYRVYGQMGSYLDQCPHLGL